VALKSTVLAPPPAAPTPRVTTVLRAGPPPKKGILDLSLGVIGLIVLLSTVGLAVAMPHKDVLPQQFNVAYLDVPVEKPSQSAMVLAGTQHDFEYQVEADDVYVITVRYSFKDDIPASGPDQFSLRLYDPQGNAAGPEITAITAPGEGDKANSPTCGVDERACAFTDYKATLFNGQFSVAFPKPADDIVEVQDQSLTEKQLAAQLQAKAHVPSIGTWKVKVTMPLSGAGGCIQPTGASQDEANRFAVCQQEVKGDPTATPSAGSAQGQDPGNPFSVDIFIYTSFAADAKKIG
jgi:hypothetical protein